MTVTVERTLKIVTSQHNIDKPTIQEGFPMKEWAIEIYILDQDGNESPAKCFTKAIYHLHPSFAKPDQTFLQPPFRCQNEGWGEFELSIDLFTTEKGGKINVMHDLNFQNAQYEVTKPIVFRNPSQALQAILRETGPLPTDEERKTKKLDNKKKKVVYDYEKMADALIKLGEDDLLQVIQLIHDYKDDATFVHNNIDAGEFSVDLYTMPEPLTAKVHEVLANASLL